MIRVLVTLGVIAALVYGIGWMVFMLPKDDSVESADAVVVLAGAEDRLPVALNLVAAGVSDQLVVSETPPEDDPPRWQLCQDRKLKGAKLTCRQADPYSTRGEARFTSRLAARNGWDTIVLVTSDYHRFRSERLFERCSDAQFLMESSEGSRWKLLKSIPLEWAKLVRAETFQRGC